MVISGLLSIVHERVSKALFPSFYSPKVWMVNTVLPTIIQRLFDEQVTLPISRVVKSMKKVHCCTSRKKKVAGALGFAAIAAFRRSQDIDRSQNCL